MYGWEITLLLLFLQLMAEFVILNSLCNLEYLMEKVLKRHVDNGALEQRELKGTMLLQKWVGPQKRRQMYQRKGPIHQYIYEHLSEMRNISCEKRDCSWKGTTGGLPIQIKFTANGVCMWGNVTRCHFSGKVQLKDYVASPGRKVVRPT